MSHEGFRYFLVILIFILVKENLLNTGYSPLEAHLVQLDIEIDLICTLSVNLLTTPHKRKYRS